jgi:hypothetical protein
LKAWAEACVVSVGGEVVCGGATVVVSLKETLRSVSELR